MIQYRIPSWWSLIQITLKLLTMHVIIDVSKGLPWKIDKQQNNQAIGAIWFFCNYHNNTEGWSDAITRKCLECRWLLRRSGSLFGNRIYRPQIRNGSCVALHQGCLVHYGDVIMGAIASQITSLTIVYSTIYLNADQGKHQRSASLAFLWGIHRRPVNSPLQWPLTRKMFPFDDVIMRRKTSPFHFIDYVLCLREKVSWHN